MKSLASDKYLIVTGGAGFIGSCLVRYLNNQGFSNIIIVDDLGIDEKWQNLVGKSFADILPIHDLFEWLDGRASEIQGIVHLGACSSTVENDADYLLDNNYRYTLELAEYALWHEIRFIYASSAATYGDGSQGFSDGIDLEKLRPLNMYGYSKHLVDLWMERQGVLEDVVGLKYFNIFGPNEGHKGRMASVIPSFVKQAQEDGQVRLFASNSPDFKDGQQARDHLYVKDAVAMTASFLENEEGGIFNIGSGQATTWNKVASAVFAALGIKEKITYIPMPEDIVGKYQNYTCAEMTKSDFTTTPIDQAIGDYVQNHLLTGQRW